MDTKIDFVFIGHINSLNRIQLLHQTLDSFCKNTNFDLVGNVVFVDDCSPIDYHISNEFFKRLFFIRNLVQLGVGGSKNKGIDFLMQLNPVLPEYIYFSDSDVYFTQCWLDNMLEAYKEFKLEIGILGGGCHPYLQTNKKIHSTYSTDVGYEIHTKDAISGWSWLTTWDIVLKYGFLAHDALGSGKSEDWEYCQRIKKDGYEVASIVPEVVSHTGITNTEGNVCFGSEFFPKLPDVLYL